MVILTGTYDIEVKPPLPQYSRGVSINHKSTLFFPCGRSILSQRPHWPFISVLLSQAFIFNPIVFNTQKVSEKKCQHLLTSWSDAMFSQKFLLHPSIMKWLHDLYQDRKIDDRWMNVYSKNLI